MREVPVSFFAVMLRTMERFGMDPRRHLRGLQLAQADPKRFGERVDWNELAVFMNRCAQHLTTLEQETLGELFLTEDWSLRLAARTIRSPRLLLHLIATVTRPILRHMEYRAQDLADGRVYLHVELPEHYVPSPLFFRAAVGEFRAVTTLLGLPPCKLESDVGPWHGYYWVRLPDQHATSNRLEQIVGRVLEELGRDLAAVLGWLFSQDVPGGGMDASHLRDEHGLTWTEAHIALRLLSGESVDRIATELGLPLQSVRAHLHRVQMKIRGRPRTDLS